ncbi:MAG: hypothetical protein KKC68_08915 [Candidatus Thermoplasmatota archaeon]|nr:hypothetical protein [Candidatus Thermoplasmatota archaeon]
MRLKITSIWLIFLLSSLLSLCFTPVIADENPEPNNINISEDNIIKAGIYVISIGNFEFTKGTYILDFYLVFKYNNHNITPTNFEFMNGRPVFKEKIYESITNESTEIWYRIQANLFITPHFKNYPFDVQNLLIIIEDSKLNTSNLQYIPLDEIIGIDEQFQPAGWNIQSYEFSIHEHIYPWEEEYSQARLSITIARETGPTVIKLLLPPLIFCIVSGLSFFFKADKITHRLGLGTSMLISAVMFHLSQTSSLPALPYLILIDKIMLSVYAFLACSLLATTIIYIDEEYWKDVDYTQKVNRYGAIITITFPLLVFSILYFL